MRPRAVERAASRRCRPCGPSRSRRRDSGRSSRSPGDVEQLAPAAPRRPPALEASAVENVERGADRALRLRVVREPPGGTQQTAIGADVLHAHALVETVLRARPPEARALDAAPGRLAGRERVAEVVHPDHAGFDATRDAARLREVARPYARSEPELAVVRTVHRLVLAVKRLDADDGPKDLLVGQRPSHHRRLEKPTVPLGSRRVCQPLDVVALTL